MTAARKHPAKRRRRFVDAPTDLRCQWDITLPDASLVQCGRRHTDGRFCTQHTKMWAAGRSFCAYCGGNDETVPEHCTDCTRPGNEAA